MFEDVLAEPENEYFTPTMDEDVSVVEDDRAETPLSMEPDALSLVLVEP